MQIRLLMRRRFSICLLPACPETRFAGGSAKFRSFGVRLWMFIEVIALPSGSAIHPIEPSVFDLLRSVDPEAIIPTCVGEVAAAAGGTPCALSVTALDVRSVLYP
jgi:hypothetical protein